MNLAAVPIVRTIAAATSGAGDIEQTLLGALMADTSAVARCGDLRPEHFERAENRQLLQAVIDCRDDVGAAEAPILLDRLRRNGAGDDVLAYAVAVAQSAPSAANVEHYAGLVKEQAQRREIAAIGADIMSRATAPDADLSALRRDVMARLDGINGHGLQALDLAVLATREPPRPREIMEGVPCGYAILSAGHGGAGKSTIELIRAVCIAAGISFFGLPVYRRRVLYLSCEDRTDVLHWRLTRICAYFGIDLAELAGWLHIVDAVGQDSVLWDRDPRTGYTLTPAFERLHETMRTTKAEVLVIDGTADTFGGNENARGEVKRYVNALVSLIPPDRGAVVLIAHVDKALARGNGTTSEGYSGSTAWHNSARARWYLYPERDDDAERTGDLILELQKANLGRADRQIRFRWDQSAHLFVGETVPDAMLIDRKHQDREEQHGIRRALKACTDAGDDVPAAMTGPRTAFHVLKVRSEFPQSLLSGKPATRRFWGHIEQLRAMKHLREEEIPRKSDRHRVRYLVLTDEGTRACG